MNEKFNRTIEHLEKNGSMDFIISAFHAVEILFTSEWLLKDDGHRLQQLWRANHNSLGNTELFVLGRAILKLNDKNKSWLESTAREIKKNIDSSHGLITEIIAIGSISSINGDITPAKQSHPGYDFSIGPLDSYHYKISLKNFDISKHKHKFQKNSDLIRKTFLEFLKRTKTSGFLQIIINQYPTDEILFNICCYICFSLKPRDFKKHEDKDYTIEYSPIANEDIKTLVSPSDKVLIICPQHYNEQRNLECKIKLANKNMHEKIVHNEHAASILMIRLNETADIIRLKNYAEILMSDKENCGFDIVLMYQSSVTTDLENNSKTIAFNAQFATSNTQKILNVQSKLGPVAINLGIGLLSSQPIYNSYVTDGKVSDVDLKEYYVYQKGNICHQLKERNNSYSGNFKSSIPGVYRSFKFSNVIMSETFPESETLLII